MSTDQSTIHESGAEAGPSSLPVSRSVSPAQHDAVRTLRRPASHGRLAKFMIPGRSRSGSTASYQETPVTAYADDGHSASGRTTPEQRRRSGKAAATSLLASDAKYKKFAGQVDKALQAFESVNEWADFISFLSRLLKTLQIPSPPYTEIPRKLIVAKRLAQCLNPALPSGVHQRALDVYAHIFSVIGPEGLRRDLLIWSSGLFPFFQFAATSVRPILIGLYETYYLPLGEELRPATKAFILALLPGMEEETGDFFDKVLSLLSQLSKSISPAFFLRNIFLILISSPQSRLAGINYLSREIAKSDSSDIQMDVGLVIRGVAAVLADENSLVRRGGLDLLLKLLPLNGGLLSEAEEADRILLVRAAANVVLQRELSLSRRVYTWLLGSEEAPDAQSAYFKEYGLELLASTLETDMYHTSTDPHDLQRPFKVFLSLLDRWEVGLGLSERLALPALKAVKAVSEQSGAFHDELIMTASAVYDAIEPVIIWRAFYTALKDGSEDSLIRWTLSTIPQKDEEITRLHLPIMVDHLLKEVDDINREGTSSRRYLQLSELLLQHIPSSLFATPGAASSDQTPLTADFLYSDSSPPPEGLGDLVPLQVVPSIVTRIFDLTKLKNDGASTELLPLLRMACYSIDIEAFTLCEIDGAEWISSLTGLLAKARSFANVDAIVDIALKASRSPQFKPRITISAEPTMSTILDSLFRYLQPQHSAHHVRAVELIWEYNQLAEIHTLENVISRRISTAFGARRIEAMDAFGVLWRLTEDSMLPGEIFFLPFLMVLDSLKSSDPDIQRTAETWMRCNLRSYFRVLDPILTRLLDPTTNTGDVSTKASTDLSFIQHLVENMATLFRFGGHGLSKACQSTEVATSTHPALAQKAQAVSPDSGMYLDLLVIVLLSHLSLQTSDYTPTDKMLLVRVQSSALEVLQMLVSRGDISPSSLDQIRNTLLDKLTLATKTQERTLQSKMLHILHSTLNSTMPVNAKSHKRSASSNEKPGGKSSEDFDRALVQVIIEGISSPANQPVLQHWVDFVLLTTASFQSRPNLIQALCDCFSFQIRDVMLQLGGFRKTKRLNGLSDAEPVMLLSGLERLLSLAGSSNSSRRSEDGRVGTEGGSGILGLMSGVFIADTVNDEKLTHQSNEHLNDAITALLVTWAVTSPDIPPDDRPCRPQQYDRIRVRTRKVLEKVFKTHTNAVIATCVSAWAEHSPEIEDQAIFDCIDSLTPSAQKVVELVTQGIYNRQSRADEAKLDPATMAFLETYISRLEAPIAVQIWNTLFGFCRDMLAAASTSTQRFQLFPLLRCLTALCQIVITTSALEDRRLRRELQDVYPKVLEAVVSNVPQSGETSSWARTSVDEKSTNGDKDDGESLYDYLADAIIPGLRSFLVDPDRVSAACVVIASNLITPKLRRHRADVPILRVALEMTKLPSSIKAWRSSVGDAFNDIRFFRNKPDEIVLWKPLIYALMDSDRERFTELLGRITAAPSANIFTNREQEMILRSSNLRRLSFVLLTAQENHYLTQLPAIQEKLVDILRTNVVSPRVHSEVYLTLRVLMCRISPQHLTNFWPVILAELLRVFEDLMDDIPPDGSESLQLALAACKFLDLLLVIQSEDFQIHQWMFVTDTTDAAYPPEGFTPTAIMDAISEILTETSHGTRDDASVLELDVDDSTTIRRPRLTKIRTISSLQQLQPFFSRASIDTFEGVYSNSGVDWNVVEEGLSGEIFSHE